MKRKIDNKVLRFEDRWYSQKQIAQILGVSLKAIQNWRNLPRGKLQSARIGHRTVRIHGRELERFLVRNEAH